MKWTSVDNDLPRDGQLILLHTHMHDSWGGYQGGVYLGGRNKGVWYWIKGLDEIMLRHDEGVDYWCLVEGPNLENT